MVYAIRAKKQIRQAILKILETQTGVHLEMLVAGLKLETGMTKRFIHEIIQDMTTIKQVSVVEGIITKTR